MVTPIAVVEPSRTPSPTIAPEPIPPPTDEMSAEDAIAAAGAAQAISREQLRSVESELDAALSEQNELEKQQQEREVEFQRAVAAQQAKEADRKRRLDEERAAALSQQKIEEERRALEAERLAREEKMEEERRALEAERQASERIEEERRALEAERQASEKIEEERRLEFEAERLAREEKIEEERRALEDERRRMAEEAALRERKAKEEMERQLLEQERSHALARQQLEEERRQAEQEQLQRQLREETARLQEERRRLQEENRAAEEQFRQRQLLESQRLQEERDRSQRLLLQDRQADEQQRIKAQLEMDREREMLRVQELHTLGMTNSSTAMPSSRPVDPSAMSVKEIKSELVSLGIDTSQFVEKKEMVKVLAEARQASRPRDDVSGPGTSIVSFRPGGIPGPAHVPPHVPPQRSSRYDGVDDDELNWRLDSYVSLSDYTIVVTRALPGPYAPDFTTGDPSMFEFVVEQGSRTPKADVYYVHKAMIAVGSRRAELLGRMIREAESARGFGAQSSENATEHNTIMLESAADAFPAVLDFMYYPDRELDMSVENAVPLVYIGKRYKIRALLELAEDFVENNLESTTAMYFLLDSYLYQLESILTRAIDVTAAHLGETVDFDPIYRLPPTLFKRIILSKDLRCDSELLSLIVYSYCGERELPIIAERALLK